MEEAEIKKNPTIIQYFTKGHIAMHYTGLMVMAIHQIYSGQIKHISSQIKFGQKNFLYIINGNFIEFAKENECPDNFQSLS